MRTADKGGGHINILMKNILKIEEYGKVNP